jgi:hypothetical protein
MKEIMEEIFRLMMELHRRDPGQKYFPELRDLEHAIKAEYPEAKVDCESGNSVRW